MEGGIAVGVRYVGGEPTRITSYRVRKNVNRWMYRKEEKSKVPAQYVFLFTVVGVEIAAFLVGFIIAYFA